MNQKFAAAVFATVIALSAFSVACQTQPDAQVSTPAKGVTEVTRHVLASGTSSRAPGQTVGLQRVIIPAGQEIAPHTHPGTQLATIAEGTLTYSVIKGEVKIWRAAGSAQAKEETVRAGQSAEIRPGDALAETTDMVHTARNDGKTAVVIYLSSLFPDGAPASSPAQ